MKVEYINLEGIVNDRSTSEQLIKDLSICVGSDKDRDLVNNLICNVVNQRRKFHLKDDTLCKFIKGFKIKDYCVYKLFFKGGLVYIGSSYDVETRITNHIKTKTFDKVEVCVKDNKIDMLELEHKLINIYTPAYNKGCNLKHSNNYRGDLLSEPFLGYVEYIHETPIKKVTSIQIGDSNGNKGLKYKHTLLKTGRNTKINTYFVREDNTPLRPTDKDFIYTPVKVESLHKEEVNTEIDLCVLDWIKDNNYSHLLETPNLHGKVHTFAGKIIFSSKSDKYRYKGNSTWYNSTRDKLKKLLQRVVDETLIELEVVPTFTFGKYKEVTVDAVKEEDPSYITWCVKNLQKEVLISLGLLR